MLELNQSIPAVFNALTDGTVYLGVANGFRGTADGRRLLRAIWSRRWSTRRRVGSGTLDEEKYRLIFVGVPCYPIFRRFNEMFAEWGGAFVSSTYLWFASGGVEPRLSSTTSGVRSRAWPKACSSACGTRWTACSIRTARSPR